MKSVYTFVLILRGKTGTEGPNPRKFSGGSYYVQISPKKVVGGSYYFQNLAEFSKEIPFKTPKCSKFFARKNGGWVLLFSKSSGKIPGGFYLGGVLLTPR